MRSEDRPLTLSPCRPSSACSAERVDERLESGPIVAVGAVSARLAFGVNNGGNICLYAQIDPRRRTGRPAPGSVARPLTRRPSPLSNGSGSSSPWKGPDENNRGLQGGDKQPRLFLSGGANFAGWQCCCAWFDRLTMREIEDCTDSHQPPSSWLHCSPPPPSW